MLSVTSNVTGATQCAAQETGESGSECDSLRPNGLALSCRERAAHNHVKIATISRAQRSAAMPGWAAIPTAGFPL